LQTAIDLFHYIQENIGAPVIAIALVAGLGVCFGLPAGKAVRASFAAGAGFVGLDLMIDLLEGTLVPAVQAVVENSGLSSDFADIGDAPFAVIVSASQIGAWILPLGVAVNLLMLATNTTRTINIDILNYRCFAYTGIMAQSASGSYLSGLAAAALNMAVVLIIADRTARRLEQYADLRGLSLPHGFSAAFVPVAFIANKIVDYLPGLNRPKADMARIQKRLGVFGEPALIGFALGFALTLIAGLGVIPLPDLLSDSLTAAVRMCAVFALTPKMIAFLMRGIGPLADAARTLARKRFKNRGLVCIGLDAACGFGHPLVLTCTPILTSVCVFLAVLLPGNRLLPFAGFAFVPYILVAVLPVTKGAFFRSLIVGAISVAVMLYCGSGLAELFMRAAAEADAETYANYAGNFSSAWGANPLTLAAVALARLHRVGLAIMAAIVVGLALGNRKRIIKEARAGGDRTDEESLARKTDATDAPEQRDETEDERP
jgi:PTS system galactitol-specific IIC component